MSDMSSVVHFEMPPRERSSYGYEPDKWTHPALEVPGLWAGHEFACCCSPRNSRAGVQPFFRCGLHLTPCLKQTQDRGTPAMPWGVGLGGALSVSAL